MNYNVVAATNEDTVVATYEPSKVRSDSYQSEAELEKEFIRLLCEQGYTYLPLHTEDELIANLRSQLEELNHYQFSDTEWRQFFSDVIANPNEHIPEKTRKIQDWEESKQVLHRDDGSSRSVISCSVFFRDKDPKNIPLFQNRPAKSWMPVQQNRMLCTLHSCQYMFGKTIFSEKRKNGSFGISG